MIREEAIKVLEMFLHKQCDLERTKFAYDANTVWGAVNMASKALEQQPCRDCISREDALMALTGDITDCTVEEYIARLRDRLSKLPSIGNEDCISRENLLKAFKDECRGECDNCSKFRKVDGEYKCRLILDLPPVTPKEKTGHWIFDEILDRHYYCSECKSMGVDYWDYCPNCGARMVEPQEREVNND